MPVYVIRAGKGPCKIGHARDVMARLADLQIATHVRLHLVAVYEGGLAEEQALHRQFAARRIGGEWFKLRVPGVLRDITLTPYVIPEPAPKQLSKWREERLRKPGGSLVCALMAAKGLQPEDLAGVVGGIEHVMDFGVRVHPRRFERLAAALGVDHQFLYYGRNFVRRPMGRPA